MYFTVLAPELKLLLWYCWYFFFFPLLFFFFFFWMLWSLDRIKDRNCPAMLTSKDSYKFVGERKRNSQADPKRITFLPLNEFYIPVGGMSTKESLYFILKIYVCYNLFLLKYRKKHSNSFSSVIVSEINFPAIWTA